MTKIGSKALLCRILSGIELFSGQKVSLEQYPTPPEIASEVLWNAYMAGYTAESECMDQGCGTGIFGIGMLLLDAERVDFVDMDESALMAVEKNINTLLSEGYFNRDIKKNADYFLINKKIMPESENTEAIPTARNEKKIYDLVIQNPPFGTKNRNIDKIFLGKAISQGKVIYSMHKTSTEAFLKDFSKRKEGEVVEVFRFRFPIKHTFSFHRKPKKDIEVSCLKIISHGNMPGNDGNDEK